MLEPGSLQGRIKRIRGEGMTDEREEDLTAHISSVFDTLQIKNLLLTQRFCQVSKDGARHSTTSTKAKDAKGYTTSTTSTAEYNQKLGKQTKKPTDRPSLQRRRVYLD